MACRIVVLISGSGTNLQALIDDLAPRSEHGQIVAVISNKADAFGLQRAQAAGIPTRALSHRDYPDRALFDQALCNVIDEFAPDLVLLAGFMRILTADFVRHFHGRLLNIHPSLLPKYKGLHTHARALEAGDREHGSTVHFVTEELDGGPLIVSARVSINATDTEASLAAKVQQGEHRLYPLAMNWFIQGRLRLQDNRACLDGQPIPEQGLDLEDCETDKREHAHVLQQDQ
ncbi:MAG: phosphoribosylglycinamide formyltransferase [Gammaproteobacteria bacterium HGW-Gammaproteobacteria-11]|nr:MAG: phosphoribosylglycinamide formyltransferase [Gammaproteobacteria bacterium HGW-Gammaproteobacteria-11]